MAWSRSLRYLMRHPLGRRHRLATLGRYLRFHLASRLVDGPVTVPFVAGTRLLLDRRGGMGEPASYYTGLSDFEGMGFLLHALRAGDLFLDVGANVGEYSVLASGVVGARARAFEPNPRTFAFLRANADLGAGFDCHPWALGARPEQRHLTTHRGKMNHIVDAGAGAGAGAAPVAVRRLDDVCRLDAPTLLKIDVEGFEGEVLDGGRRLLDDPLLFALIIELNGSGRRFGVEDEEIHQRLVSHGLAPVAYDPRHRRLVPRDSWNRAGHNTLYVRDLEATRQRLRDAPAVTVAGERL